MTPQMALDFVYSAVMTAAMLSAPIMVTAIVVGVAVNIIQTVTSIKDMSLTFVPKVAAAIVVLTLSLPWIIQSIVFFFERTFGALGTVAHGV